MLSANVQPTNAANQNVTWHSSNTAVAIVNASGGVTSVSQGAATITVTTVDGGFTATSEVTVIPRVTMQGSGTESDPFIITTAAELDSVRFNSWAQHYSRGY